MFNHELFMKNVRLGIVIASAVSGFLTWQVTNNFPLGWASMFVYVFLYSAIVLRFLKPLEDLCFRLSLKIGNIRHERKYRRENPDRFEDPDRGHWP